MSKPSLTGREQQQSSPFGLGHKRAKKAKKYGAFAPYLHHIQKKRCKRAISAPYFSCVTRPLPGSSTFEKP